MVFMRVLCAPVTTRFIYRFQMLPPIVFFSFHFGSLNGVAVVAAHSQYWFSGVRAKHIAIVQCRKRWCWWWWWRWSDVVAEPEHSRAKRFRKRKKNTWALARARAVIEWDRCIFWNDDDVENNKTRTTIFFYRSVEVIGRDLPNLLALVFTYSYTIHMMDHSIHGSHRPIVLWTKKYIFRNGASDS